MLGRGRNGDISDNELYHAISESARRDQGKAYVMPGQTDLYVPAEDQPVRGRSHAQTPSSFRCLDLGPFRGRSRHQSERRRLIDAAEELLAK